MRHRGPRRGRGRRRWLATLLPLGLLALTGCTGSTLANRGLDPVVLQGSNVTSLTGIAPNSVVAFRFTNDKWVQIPMQVDERAVVAMRQIYNGVRTMGLSVLAYTDAATFTGPDPDATIDVDDEIVFMARDAGGPAPEFAEPPGVVAGSGVQVRVTDPLDPDGVGYVYLFRQAGGLDPAAGGDYVTYQFNLLSGDYKTTYALADGPNPEDTLVTTARYRHHFSDRWLSDRLEVTYDGASGVDILDRHKARLAPGECGRSEDTFNDAEGAFVTTKDGPVRAIRSYVGANSGPSTQRTHLFYEGREDIVTNLRVHQIPGVVDFFDYSPAASGMRYANNLNQGGVTIDGNPDTVTAGNTAWESVAGEQGAIVAAHRLDTNLALTPTHYYLDDSTPPIAQCTGDAFAYAASGPWINQSIACTDPDATGTGCQTNHLTGTRTLYVEKRTLSNAEAAIRANQALNPLTSTVTPWHP